MTTFLNSCRLNFEDLPNFDFVAEEGNRVDTADLSFRIRQRKMGNSYRQILDSRDNFSIDGNFEARKFLEKLRENTVDIEHE